MRKRIISCAVAALMLLSNPVTASSQSAASTYAVATVTVTPTVTSGSAYAAGNCVGGLLTFPNAFRGAYSGTLQSFAISVKSVQTAGFKIYLFDANPTASTFTNKTACTTIAANDSAKLVGEYALTSYDSGLGNTIYTLSSVVHVMASNSPMLYAVLVTTGTPTFTTTSDLSVSIGIAQN